MRNIKDVIIILPSSVLMAGGIMFAIYLTMFIIYPPNENTETLLRISYICFAIAAISILIIWLWSLNEFKNKYWEDEFYKGLWFKVIIYNPLAGPIAYHYCIVRYERIKKCEVNFKSKNYLKKIKNKSLLDKLCFIYYWGALITLIPLLLLFLLTDIKIIRILGIIIVPMITFVVPACFELFYLLILIICGSLPKSEWQTLNAFNDLKTSSILFGVHDFYYSVIRNKIVK